MEGEQVLSSYWFRQLTSRHRRLCLRAASDGLFVCVPQTCSLASWSVSEKDIGMYKCSSSCMNASRGYTL